MSSVSRRGLLAVSGAMTLGGCLSSPKIDLALITPEMAVDQIIVRIEGQGEDDGFGSAGRVGVITEPERLAALVEFANAHRDRFFVPFEGAPIAEVKAEFRAGDSRIILLGVGQRYLIREIMHYRPIKPAEGERALALLGVDPARLKRWPVTNR